MVSLDLLNPREELINTNRRKIWEMIGDSSLALPKHSVHLDDMVVYRNMQRGQ